MVISSAILDGYKYGTTMHAFNQTEVTMATQNEISNYDRT